MASIYSSWPALMGSLSKQFDIESTESRLVCSDLLREPVRLHRKLWEYIYILSMLSLDEKLFTGSRGLGFGCGKERLVPALAAAGCELLVTDLALEEAAQKGWVRTNQHSSDLSAWGDFIPSVCVPEVFERNVQFSVTDMNNIESHLLQQKYDFVWSSCSLEHLGSLRHGLEFVKSSLGALKPGGIAIHTTEYNLYSNDKTVDRPSTAYYRRKDMEWLEEEVKGLGCTMYPIDYSPGVLPQDDFIDQPPFKEDVHLKLALNGYVISSIGFCIRRDR